VNSPGLPIPQNSPEEVRHTTSPELLTPPATTFFSAFTSRVERAVQQIISPNRENPLETSASGNVLDIPIRVELQNSANIEEPLENLNFLEDTSIQNLFPTPSLISPFDEIYSTSDRLHSIGRPIGEDLISPPNRLLLNSNPHIYRQPNHSNVGRNQIESNKGLLILDSLERGPILPLEPITLLPETQHINQGNQIDDLLPLGPILPLLAITHTREEEDIEKRVIVNPQRRTPSNSSSASSNPPTPPSPPIQDIEGPEEMAQP
jgi:hypothetical protein